MIVDYADYAEELQLNATLSRTLWIKAYSVIKNNYIYIGSLSKSIESMSENKILRKSSERKITTIHNVGFLFMLHHKA